MNVEIIQETCCKCNVIFWITEEHYKRLANCKNTFYCPNGHPQSYTGDTDKTKLERASQHLASERINSESLARSNSALKGVITKMKNKRDGT